MGDICKLDPPATLVPARVHGSTTPPRRINLKTRQDVRRELGRLYRDARSGVVETQDATRLAYVLSTISKIIGEIEQSGQGGGMTYEDYLREMHEKIIARQNDQKRPAKLATQTTMTNDEHRDVAVTLSASR